MFRYVAFVWDPSDISQAELARRLGSEIVSGSDTWRTAEDSEGLIVYCAYAPTDLCKPIPLAGKRGLFMGALVADRAGGTHVKLTERVVDRVTTGRGRPLVHDYWGQYVCFIRSDDLRSVFILRDPTGMMRCYVIRHDGLHIFCSNLEDCVHLGLRFTINWKYLAAELSFSALMGWRQTGLNEVSCVLPGECWEISAGRSTITTYWDAASISKEPLTDIGEAVSAMRSTVKECVRAWASLCDKVVLLLSGGLDSSIVLACIQDMPRRPNVTCLNFYSRASSDDERTYASLSAVRAGYPIHFEERSVDVSLRDLLTLPASARYTCNHLDHLLFRKRTAAFASECGSPIVFSGQMGDQLFGLQASVYAVIDNVWMHGISRQLHEIASRFARFSGLGLHRALAHGVAIGMLFRYRKSWLLRWMARNSNQNTFLNSKAMEELDSTPYHDWATSIEHLPPGKLFHIASIASAQAYYAPIGSPTSPEWVLPLYSQPVIELCLRIPTYMFLGREYARAIPRQAFADDLPSEIVHRKIKGRTVSQRTTVLHQNRTFIRELLLGGILAQRGFLDVRAVQLMLHDEHAPLDTRWLAECIKAEAWLRIWADRMGHL